MGKHSGIYLEETILERCKCWFDMVIDNDWEDVLEREQVVSSYILVFKRANDKYVKPSHADWWIELDTILNDMEVAIDGEEEKDFYLWVECLDHLWEHITTSMI